MEQVKNLTVLGGHSSPYHLSFSSALRHHAASHAEGLFMKNLLFVLAGVAVLSGCTKTVEEMGYSERNALAGQIVKRCMAQGVKTGTAEMRKCTQAEAESEVYSRRNNAVRRQHAAAAFSQGMGSISQGYYNASANASAMNRSVTCNRVPSPAGYSTVRCY